VIAAIQTVDTFATPSAPPRLPPGLAWSLRASPPPLHRGEAHLWRVRVPATGGIPAGWRELLTPEERARADRKRVPLDARRTLASRACLRLLLGHYLQTDPAEIALTANAAGKPQLASGAAGTVPLEFNVSHSGDWLVLAFSRGLPLGVDVEEERELEFDDLVRSFFSPPERAAWTGLPAAARRRAFFSAWTRKEAYVKALGLGLLKPLDSFAVACGPDDERGLIWCASDDTAPQRWQIVPVAVAPGYACALAVDTAATALHTFAFTSSERRAASPAPEDSIFAAPEPTLACGAKLGPPTSPVPFN